MRIVVFGAGAIGSALGAILSRSHDVTLLARPAHAAAIRADGLTIEGANGFQGRIRAEDRAETIGPTDLVFLTVKAYDTVPALVALRPLMAEETILLTGQNGLGNWESAREAYPRNAVLGASVTMGATLEAPGRVRWGGTGEVVIGGRPEDAPQSRRVADAFTAAGIDAKTTDNLMGTLWLKAIVNAAINPLTALHRVPNGQLLDNPRLRETMKRVCDECVRVARTEGVRLPVPDPWSVVEGVARKTAANRSSMLQSVERGQRTEIEAITGRILEAARRHNVACPENERLYAAVRGLQPRATTRS